MRGNKKRKAAGLAISENILNGFIDFVEPSVENQVATRLFLAMDLRPMVQDILDSDPNLKREIVTVLTRLVPHIGQLAAVDMTKAYLDAAIQQRAEGLEAAAQAKLLVAGWMNIRARLKPLRDEMSLSTNGSETPEWGMIQHYTYFIADFFGDHAGLVLSDELDDLFDAITE